jgi:hypothetical protein
MRKMNPIKRAANRVRQFFIAPLLANAHDAPSHADPVVQLLLRLSYEKLHSSGAKLPDLADTGFKRFSQTDEDGILWYIFSIIGTRSKLCVEICAGDGTECNTANLIINHGWHGLLVDGNEALVARAKEFYSRNGSTYCWPPKIISSWVTTTNVNEILRNNGFSGEIDLLSLDMDGIDYWILDAIHEIAPRVIVLEYLDILGPDRSLTIPYSESFNGWQYVTGGMPDYFGASLSAFAKLADKKGYRLIGCNRLGYNAFFIRKDLGLALPTIGVRQCFTHPKVIQGIKERFPKVAALKWVEV